jgi:AraC-like DNA-binding protein
MQPQQLHGAAAPNEAHSIKLGFLDCVPNRTVPPGYMDLGAAKGIRATLRELGADPEQVIAEAGVDPRLFDDPDNLISAAALGGLVLHCVEQTRCSHFGLLLGSKATLDSLRVVGMLMSSSTTLGEALALLATHLRFQNRGAVIHLEIHAEIVVLGYSVYEPRGEGALHISEGGLATAIRVIRELCRSELAPIEVLIPRRPPANPEPYHRLFRAPVRFNQESAALVFPTGWLEYRIPNADAAACTAIESRVLELEKAAPTDLRDELRRRLRIELMRTKCSASAVARGFAIHRRTLNRHLRAEGTGYKTIADEVRFGIARQLLADTDLHLAEIAAALDFSEPAAFTRAFHRWAGRAPREWRVRANQGRPRA